MRPTARLVGATIGLVVALPVVVLVPRSYAEAPPPAAESAPAPALDATTRLAFTDERDGLVEASFDCVDPDGCDDPVELAPAAAPAGPPIEHQGEASRSEIGLTFVSTLDSDDGDVYLRPPGGGPVQPVTCDTGEDSAIETHPVGAEIVVERISSSESWVAQAVAYASDADGDWDIYVSFSRPVVEGEPEPVPALSPLTRAAAAPTTCDPTWQTVNVTNTSGTDELWPTFVGDRRLAYSTAELDPQDADRQLLPDLGITELEWSVADQVTATEAVLSPGSSARLTTTPSVAETQPAAMRAVDEGADRWIAFTTTRYRTDGSIAVMAPRPGAPSHDLFESDEPHPQSSEPAWSVSTNPDSIAFTSTTDDPYGDIYAADLESDGRGDPPTVEEFVRLAASARGIAESHPVWTVPFETEDDPTRSIAFTSRASGELIDDPDGEDRDLHGDIGDVLALDGGDRRVVRAQSGSTPVTPYDEAGPSYSPDGEQMVYSRALPSGGRRILMVGDADGSGAPRRLLPIGDSPAASSDTDPVWSPDGTRVAFVRTIGDGSGGSAVWVFDVATEDAVPVSGDGVVDLHPTWSPDSRWIMVGRSEPIDFEVGWGEDGARRQPRVEHTQGPYLTVLDPEDPGGPGLPLDWCDDLCDVDGRSPAWSPTDPGTIAYVDHGSLWTVEVAVAPDASSWPAEEPVAVTGFEFGPVPEQVAPTQSRGTVETAEDPAWSDDGTEIAFSGQPTGQPDNRGIYAIKPDGTGLRTITDDRGPETEPAYARTQEADLEVSALVLGSPAVMGGSVTIVFTLTNHGPDTADDVALTTSFPAAAEVSTIAPVPADCRVDGTGCDLAQLASGASLMYRLQVVHQAAIGAVGTATVMAATTDPVPGNNTDDAPYQFEGRLVPNGDLSVRVRPAAPLGYVGGSGAVTIVVSNRGSDPVEDVELDVTWPVEVTRLPDPMPEPCLLFGISCSLGTLDAGDRVELPVPLGFDVEGEALPITATATTTTNEVMTDNNVDEALLDILQPELRILPAVARPGQVVLAYGEKMPPGTEIEVAWSGRTATGNDFGSPITVNRGPFEISDEGTVRIPLLVLRRDDLGTRFLTAVSTTAAFSDLETTLLVVQRTLGPPTFAGRG